MAQLGEGVAAGPPPQKVKVQKLKAKVIEVSFVSSQRTSLGKAEIKAPHWSLGTNPLQNWKSLAKAMKLAQGPYATHPAVYLVKGAAAAKFDVEVKVEVIESENITGDGELRGGLGLCEIVGKCPTSVGTHTVSAKIENPPKEIVSIRGDVNWTLQHPDIASTIGATFAEIYFVLGPANPSYAAHGVWAEVLRFVFGRVTVFGDDPVAIAQAVTRYCHGGHRLKYDTTSGAPKYFSAAGDVSMLSYLKRSNERTNCYDQASVVQTLCGALGISQEWIYLNPYGYIKTTQLIGIGACNNPFFASPSYSPKKIVDPLDPKRSAFGNHAFCRHGGKIYDACAGPSTGSDSLADYIASAIDHTPQLLARMTPGEEKDAQVFPPMRVK